MTNIRRVCSLLESVYGKPECNPKYGPLDELMLTILSQNTSSANYNRAYANLRRTFASWDDVLSADSASIEEAIRCGGLARAKAKSIKSALERVRSEHGKLSLDFLADMQDEEALAYLKRFDGVGLKTASCVLMFALGRPVLPVDTHVHRLSQRLGLIDPSVSAEAAHDILKPMVATDQVYSFHVNLVRHGRQVCKARSPSCDICVMLDICPSGRRFLASGGVL